MLLFEDIDCQDDMLTPSAVAERYRDADDETRRMVDRLLNQDADDRAWASQLGPALRQSDVARLLGKSKQAVSADGRLLRLELRSGPIAYPAFQFDGRRQLDGVATVVALLAPVTATPWTIASWLTSPQPALGGVTPIDALRAGDLDPVVAAAGEFADGLAA
jgi:hypothetical protein